MATPPPSASPLKPGTAVHADPAARKSAAENSPASRRGVLRPVLIAAIVLVLVVAAAGGIYWARHRKPSASAGRSARLTGKSSPAQSKSAAPAVVADLPLDPFVVNLADAGGHSYARIGLTLHVATAAGAKPAAAEKDGGAEAAGELRDMARDQIISVLNRQQSQDLLAPDGKEHLKQAIAAAIAAKHPGVRVVDMYFTQFLIQS